MILLPVLVAFPTPCLKIKNYVYSSFNTPSFVAQIGKYALVLKEGDDGVGKVEVKYFAILDFSRNIFSSGHLIYFLFFYFFLYVVEALGRASTVNGSGHNREKREAKHVCMWWTRWTQKETPRRENWKNWKEGFGWG